MATDTIRVSARFPVNPERLYQAWLNQTEHARFTGGTAAIEPVVGGRLMAWDDYISGMIVQLEHGRRIVQTWRTTEFPDAAPDSRLEVLFEPEGEGTRLTLIHSDLPEGDGDKYEEGWIDYYFEPMQRYFRRVVAEERAPAAAPRAARIKVAPRVSAKSATRKAAPRTRTSAKKGSARRKRVKRKVVGRLLKSRIGRKLLVGAVKRKVAKRRKAAKRAVKKATSRVTRATRRVGRAASTARRRVVRKVRRVARKVRRTAKRK